MSPLQSSWRETSLVASVARPMTRDMRFMGMYYIISGALACLTIIGAIAGVPLIISGIRLRESAEAFSDYAETNDLSALEEALERQGRFFFIQKVFAVIAIVGAALYVCFLIFFGAAIITGILSNS